MRRIDWTPYWATITFREAWERHGVFGWLYRGLVEVLAVVMVISAGLLLVLLLVLLLTLR